MNNLLTSDDVKRLPIEYIDDILAPMRFKTLPLEHQARCLTWALERRRLAYWLDVGTGKTLLALYTLQIWGCRCALIICPNSVTDTWADEIDKHLGWDYVVLKGTAEERRRKLAEDHRLYIINYEGLRVLWGRKIGNKYRPDIGGMEELDFDAIIADEIHRCKNPRALSQRLTRELSRRVDYAIVMTGTPLTKDHKDLWAEMDVMDQGRSLGNNYWGFVRTYFRPSGFDWKLKEGSLEKILEKLAPHTIRFERADCFDLPEKTYERRNVPMSAEQLGLIDEVLGVAQQTNPDLASWNRANVLDCGNKLAQIAGGFIYVDGETKALNSNPKLRELERIIEEVSGKFIIYHRFRAEGRMVEEMLAKIGISFRSARGEIKNKDQQISEFKSDPSVRALVAHPACGGEGINLFEAATIIFYSNGYHFAHREQAEGRIYRLGQTQKCLYVDIVATEGLAGDSIDHRILRALKHKGDIAGEVLSYIRGREDAEYAIEGLS